MQTYYNKFFEIEGENPYNYLAMEEFEFINDEFSFLEELKNSSCYKEMKYLSEEIEKDEELLSLAKKRDVAFKVAQSTEDEEKKHQLLVEFSRLDDELKEKPLMKEYLARYQAIRRLLNHLQDGLMKEIKI